MTNPTRSEMAAFVGIMTDFIEGDEEALQRATIAHLRQSCATCQHFHVEPMPRGLMGSCRSTRGLPFPPADGTGYCHEYKEKP